MKNINYFKGKHCETTATGTLLKNLGIDFSEEMLFGLSEGLGYIYWDMKIMDFPFIGGRIKPDLLTKNLTTNLNLNLKIKETSSIKKAWRNVKDELDNNKIVGLKLDCYHLEYFTQKIHFAGHYVAIYDYDEKYAYLVDTFQQGGKVKTSLKSLELARNEKGPMSSKNRSYTITMDKTRSVNKFSISTEEFKEILVKAIKNNAKDYLNPPIKNLGYKGIYKTSVEIKKWFKKSQNKRRDFTTTAMLMEDAGTGGAIFRNFYRDFLKESYQILKTENINIAYNMFIEIAILWKEVSTLFNLAGETEDIQHINKASEILVSLSEKEKKAMELLL